MEQEKKDTWFPAKKYGYGWGFPHTWQGWAVFAAYFVLLMMGYFWMLGHPARTFGFILYVLALSGLLIFICYKKGEKPQWRWGGKK